MDPQSLSRPASRATEIVSVTITMSLISLVVFVTQWVTPLFEWTYAEVGLAMPLGVRLVLGATRFPVLLTVVSVAVLTVIVLRNRGVAPNTVVRRALPFVNLLCVVALVGLTTGAVDFLRHIRPIVRGLAERQGYVRTSPPAGAAQTPNAPVKP
jgi:hypothetical protein